MAKFSAYSLLLLLLALMIGCAKKSHWTKSDQECSDQLRAKTLEDAPQNPYFPITIAQREFYMLEQVRADALKVCQEINAEQVADSRSGVHTDFGVKQKYCANVNLEDSQLKGLEP